MSESLAASSLLWLVSFLGQPMQHVSVSELIDQVFSSALISTRENAVSELVRRKGSEKEAVSRFISAMGHADPEVRRWAAFGLKEYGARAAPAVPALQRALSDSDQHVRIAAECALQWRDTDDVLFKRCFEHPETEVAITAARVLCERDPTGERFLARFVKALSSDRALRSNAAMAIGLYGPKAECAVEPLMECLKDDHARASAIQALGCIGPGARRAGPTLFEILKSDPANRSGAASALGRMGPFAAPILRKGLSDDDPRVRSWCCVGIHYFATALSSDDVEGLIGLLGDPDGDVRLSVLELLKEVPKEQAASIEKALMPGGTMASLTAARVLLHWDPSNVSGLAAVLSCAKSNDSALRKEAIVTGLANLGSHGGPAVEILRAALADADQEIRMRAAMHLGDIGPAARLATKELIRALVDPDEEVRTFSCRAFALIEPNPNDVLGPLIGRLSDTSVNVRAWAAEALGNLGKAAQPALRQLQELEGDQDSSVRDSARRALRKLHGAGPHT